MPIAPSWMPKSEPARMIIARRMSTIPCSAYLNVPPTPITNAITSRSPRPSAGCASTYIIEGTPTKPPTAIVAARMPVESPGDREEHRDRALSALK